MTLLRYYVITIWRYNGISVLRYYALAIAPQEHLTDDRLSVGVGDVVNGGDGLRDEEVRHFATGDGAIVTAQSHGIGAVERHSVQGLGGQQPHLDARQGERKLHVARGG